MSNTEKSVDLDIGWAKRAGGSSELSERDYLMEKVNAAAVIRSKLIASASGKMSNAALDIAKGGVGRLSRDQYGAFMEQVRHTDELLQMEQRFEAVQDRYQARVVSEPRVYAPDSPHSYYQDRSALVVDRGMHEPQTLAARDRLAQYDREITYEVQQRSAEGERAVRCVREHHRQEMPEQHQRATAEHEHELRSLATGGGVTVTATSGASTFVTPYFLTEKWAPFRGVHRSFADWCDSVDMPSYGMHLWLPAFTSATGVAQYTENNSVQETDPSTGLRGAAVVPIAGEITLSGPLYDRAYRTGAVGGGFDVALNGQLQQDLDTQIDAYALAQAIAGITAITGAASFTIAGLYQDLAKAREQLTDTSGTRLRPTTFFSTSDFYSFVTRQVDATTNRPIVTPQFAPALPIQIGGDTVHQKWSRFTGTILPGSVLWIEDDNIPASSGNNQLLLSAPDQAVVLAEGEPVIEAIPQPDAVNIGTLIRLKAYVCAIPRYPAGTANVVGAAYPSTLI